MNIKHTDKNAKMSQNKSKKRFASPNSVRLRQKNEPARQQTFKSIQKVKKPKQCHNLDRQIFQVKSPPLLKREKTEQSSQNIKKSINLNKKKQVFNYSKQKSLSKRYGQNKKIHSDEESTNIYRCNKQSADQQTDPYKISSSRNMTVKQKSIKPSRDISISFMCQGAGEKGSLHKNVQAGSGTHTFGSLHELKKEIKDKLKAYKSLTKSHEQQNEYFLKKISLNEVETKRLKKIHFVEIKMIKEKIFQLRDEIDSKLSKLN